MKLNEENLKETLQKIAASKTARAQVGNSETQSQNTAETFVNLHVHPML